MLALIHSSEVEAMLQFLNLEFNCKVIELEKFCVHFVGNIKSRSMTEVYESIFKFIGFQNKLSELKIDDPIFASDAFKGRGDAEPALSIVSDKCRCGCIKILQASAHLKKLKVTFKESPTKWNLGFIYLRAQKFLREIWLEGLPVNEVHTVILNSATTLESICVSGPTNCKKKSCFDFSYTKNCLKLTRLVVRNIDVENSHEIPEGVKILEINVTNGKSLGWNISPTLTRVKGRVTMSTKVVRIFLKQFECLERIALINIGFMGLELAKTFLKLPNLKLLVVSHVNPEVLPDLLTIPGIFLENYTANADIQGTMKPMVKSSSCTQGVKLLVESKYE
ncbi:unnamed protein product [Allacma fusca]|uniref:Uncharacterized protein n=1 Tax=Allacma fusca TaxID=39272 RepID=A0A8J2NMF7_9HEXA|nr:unnamed protein product [Allacma fusca]